MIRKELQHLAINIDEIHTHPSNVRQGDVGAICESLKAHGQYRAIVFQKSTGRILAGNHTWKAAKALGWSEIAATPVVCDDQQALRILLADNKANDLATYDEPELVELLKQLADTDEGLLGTLFDEDELDSLIADQSHFELPSDVDDVPDNVPVVSKLGDVWLLGDHRVMCGDSISDVDVAVLMNGNKANMAFTDPPYGVAYTGGLQFKDGEVTKNNRQMIMNDDKDIYADVFPMLSKYVDGACYIWFAGTKASNLYQAAEKSGDIHALIIWVKNGGYGALNANYKQKHEPCLYWKPKNTTLNFVGATTETTIWEIDKDGINKLHPTQKPVALASKAIKNHDAQIVLDLFGGSGSTLIAAQETNRVAYLMELDPHYVDVICARYQKHTGNQPVLEATGEAHNFTPDAD
jgi:site-specific DNA-methyltransferase (adenine-specific)